MKLEDPKEVGKRLKAVRFELEISQKDFAAMLDISGSYLSELESGKTKPGFNFLVLITQSLKVSPIWLLLGEGPMFLVKKNKVEISPEDFGDQWTRVSELLYYLKNSPLVQSTVLGFSSKFLYDNEDIIHKDIEKYKDRENDSSQAESTGNSGRGN